MRYWVKVEERPLEWPRYIWSAMESPWTDGHGRTIIAQGRSVFSRVAQWRGERAIKKHQERKLMEYEV